MRSTRSGRPMQYGVELADAISDCCADSTSEAIVKLYREVRRLKVNERPVYDSLMGQPFARKLIEAIEAAAIAETFFDEQGNEAHPG